MKLIEVLKNNKYNLDVDNDLSYDGDKIMVVKGFIEHCIDELDITGKFSVKIISNRDDHGVVTTAYYKDSDKLVVIYGKNRMLGDIMRSLAHELVHKKQYEEDRIEMPIPDVGGEIEDEANAMAGVLVKKFIKYHKFGDKLFD